MKQPASWLLATILTLSFTSAVAAQIDADSALRSGQYTVAIPLLSSEAAQGNGKAMYNLAYLYEHGLGTPQNYQQAAKYYQLSANQDYQPAFLNLGYMYANGYGLTQNSKTAIFYYQKAADSGQQAEAFYSIGMIYYYGIGLNVNHHGAFVYFSKAAANGNITSNYYLGQIYLQGQGVKPDYQQAYNYFYKATLLGDPDANQGLATLYAKLTPQQIQQLQNGTFQMSEVGQKPVAASSPNASLIQQLPAGSS